MERTLTLLALAAALATGQGAGTGLGIILGEPTGLSAKLWLGEAVALDAAAAWSIQGHGSVHLHADVLYHSFELSSLPKGLLPAYAGVGGRFKLAGTGPGQHPRLGFRAPFGFEYLFADAPVGLFLEVVPLFDLLPGTEFGISGGLGARWYFR